MAGGQYSQFLFAKASYWGNLILERVSSGQGRERIMQNSKWVALSALLIAATGGISRGSITTYTANLDGPSESPPNVSPATGFAQVDYDNVAQTLHVHVTFSGLTTPNTASHIHGNTAVPGAGNAGVITTTPTFPGFPSGVTSGSYDGTLDLTSAGSYNPAFVTANGGLPQAEAALIAGLGSGETYLNIHTTQFPGGEIRGFLVPEPTSLTLLGVGAGVLLMRRRRGRR
jgi:hypothetical protein